MIHASSSMLYVIDNNTTAGDALYHDIQQHLSSLFHALYQKKLQSIPCVIRAVHVAAQTTSQQKKLWSYVFAHNVPSIELHWSTSDAPTTEYDFTMFTTDAVYVARNSPSFDLDLLQAIGGSCDAVDKKQNCLRNNRNAVNSSHHGSIPSHVYVWCHRQPRAKTIAFHVHHYSVRGTEVAIYDYACYNEAVLGNRSLIASKHSARDWKHPLIGNVHSDAVYQKFADTFPMFEYNTPQELETWLEKTNVSMIYSLESGEKPPAWSYFASLCELSRPLAVHCIFQCADNQKHGASYTALSASMNKSDRVPIVPHICTPLPFTACLRDRAAAFRKQNGIPDDAVVFGRYGGYEAFDVPCAHEAIRRVLREIDDNTPFRRPIYFLFASTKPFVHHPHVIYLSDAITNLEEKAVFVEACDAMIHARTIGETFGLAIAEFTSLRKPIITWKHDGPRHPHEDTHHLDTLGDTGMYYRDADSLYTILASFPTPVVTESNIHNNQSESSDNGDNRHGNTDALPPRPSTRPNIPIPVDYSVLYNPLTVMNLFDKHIIRATIGNRETCTRIKLLCYSDIPEHSRDIARLALQTSKTSKTLRPSILNIEFVTDDTNNTDITDNIDIDYWVLFVSSREYLASAKQRSVPSLPYHDERRTIVFCMLNDGQQTPSSSTSSLREDYEESYLSIIDYPYWQCALNDTLCESDKVDAHNASAPESHRETDVEGKNDSTENYSHRKQSKSLCVLYDKSQNTWVNQQLRQSLQHFADFVAISPCRATTQRVLRGGGYTHVLLVATTAAELLFSAQRVIIDALEVGCTVIATADVVSRACRKEWVEHGLVIPVVGPPAQAPGDTSVPVLHVLSIVYQALRDNKPINTPPTTINARRDARQEIQYMSTFVPCIAALVSFLSLPVFTVNLDTRIDKWMSHRRVMRQAQWCGGEPTRFSALRGRDIDTARARELFTLTPSYVADGRNTDAIMGCALSHYELWKQIARSHQPCVILEDDISIDTGSLFLGRAAAMWVSLTEKDVDWELLFIGYHLHETNLAYHHLPVSHMTDTYARYDIVSYLDTMACYGSRQDAVGLHGGGTFGYVLHPRGAQRLLDMVHQTKFYFPVDYQILDCALRFGLKTYVCAHPLVHSPKFGLHTTESDIQTHLPH